MSKKVLYLGENTETKERLKELFPEVAPAKLDMEQVKLNIKDSDKTWPMYANMPGNPKVLVIESNDEELVRKGVDYAACFSIPMVIMTNAEVVKKIISHLRWLSGDNKISIAKYTSSLERLSKMIEHTVSKAYNSGVTKFGLY